MGSKRIGFVYMRWADRMDRVKEWIRLLSARSHVQVRGYAYLIFRIRCNNIHIRILLHLILEIRYAVPYPCGLDVDINT